MFEIDIYINISNGLTKVSIIYTLLTNFNNYFVFYVNITFSLIIKFLFHKLKCNVEL